MLRWAWLVAAKDLKIEFRARGRILAMIAFVLLAVFLFAVSLDRTRVDARDMAGPLVWLVMLFASTVGSARAFDAEDEDDAFRHLLLAPVPRPAIFLGKAAANAFLVSAVATTAFAAFAVFLDIRAPGPLAAHAGVLLPGVIGLAATGTFFGRLSRHSALGDTLLPVLTFPLLVPVTFFGSVCTARLLLDRPWSEVAGFVRLLWAFAVGALAAGSLLFRHVADD